MLPTFVVQTLRTSFSPFLEKEDDSLREWVLTLTLRCLSFDFIGTNPDESSVDFGSLQVLVVFGLWSCGLVHWSNDDSIPDPLKMQVHYMRNYERLL